MSEHIIMQAGDMERKQQNKNYLPFREQGV